MFFFFFVAPFCSCPASLVSRKFFAVGPGCAKCFFFCCAPLGAATFRRGQSKKINTTQGVFFLLRPRVFFFALAPCRRPTGLLLPLPFAGTAAKIKIKKTPWVVFFFLLWPRAGTGLLLPLPFPGAGAKTKKHPGWCFFFCCGPARTLTHSLRAWAAMPPPRRGGRPHPDRGGVFFCCGPARTLTHSLWAGAISARPGWCFFFCCGPAGSF